MKNLKLVFLLLLSIIFIASCSSNSTDNENSNPLNPIEAYEELNISYGSDSDQVFDLYLPSNRTSATKKIVLIHG